MHFTSSIITKMCARLDKKMWIASRKSRALRFPLRPCLSVPKLGDFLQAVRQNTDRLTENKGTSFQATPTERDEETLLSKCMTIPFVPFEF